MKQAVVGIDPDSKQVSLVVLRKGQPPYLRKKRISEKTSVARTLDGIYLWLYRVVKELVAEGYEVHVFVEAPFASPKTIRAVIPLSRLNGVLLAAPVRAGATSSDFVYIQDWKKAIVGNGGASKPQIAAWVKREWRAVWDEAAGRQDLMDAHCIALYGERIVDHMQKVQDWKVEHNEVEYTPKKQLRKTKD